MHSPVQWLKTPLDNIRRCSNQLIPDTMLSFFFAPSWRQPTVELMGPSSVVPLHQEMSDIALGPLSRSVTRGRYPFRFQAAKNVTHQLRNNTAACSAATPSE